MHKFMKPVTAANSGLVNCLVCHQLAPIASTHCKRCNTALSSRIINSVQISLSLLVTAVLLYIPANIYPIMSTELLGDTTESTIIGGIILFLEHESYFIAAVILIVSVILPIAKMFALAWLCYSANRADKIKQYDLTQLYRVTEFIGKWSMVDVFVVAILVALLQLGEIMSIKAGFAASAFAGVVIMTMVSAHKFDTRFLWDKVDEE
ncbi:MAG: paraquat-inducible protein A [Glaciecola sp.]|jgi:paraquat-inducible protein A